MSSLTDNFRKFIFQNPQELLPFIRTVMERPDLKLNNQAPYQRTKTINGEEIPYLRFLDGNKKVEALIDFVDGPADSKREGYYLRYLDAAIARRYMHEGGFPGEDEYPDAYVIFFYKDDLHGKGLPKYTAVNYVTDSEGNIIEPANDGTYIIEVNCAYEGEKAVGKQLLREIE